MLGEGMFSMTNTPKTGPVPALERGLSILEKLARSRQGLTLSQLSRYLELPKSSVHCLLLTFERCGYLNRDSHSGRFRLGLRICDLASAALRNVGLRDLAAPLLRQLQERTGLTVHLAILERGQAVIVEKCEPPGSSQVPTWLGKCMDLHCTALGKALAAYLTEEQLDEQIRVHGLLRHNDNTICTPRKLKLELGLIRERGYSVDDEEEEIGGRCVGAPILNSKGEASRSDQRHWQYRGNRHRQLAASDRRRNGDRARYFLPARAAGCRGTAGRLACSGSGGQVSRRIGSRQGGRLWKSVLNAEHNDAPPARTTAHHTGYLS